MPGSPGPEDQGFFLAGLHAGGHKPPGQPLFAEIAFFHHPFGRVGNSGLIFLIKGRGSRKFIDLAP